MLLYGDAHHCRRPAIQFFDPDEFSQRPEIRWQNG
jgi:hypothetical protein